MSPLLQPSRGSVPGSHPATVGTAGGDTNSINRGLEGANNAGSIASIPGSDDGHGSVVASSTTQPAAAGVDVNTNVDSGSNFASAPMMDPKSGAATIPEFEGQGNDKEGKIDGDGGGGDGGSGGSVRAEGEGGEDGEAAGTWWGVGGWFTRRSGTSPPLSQMASVASVGGVDGSAVGGASVNGSVQEGGQATGVGRNLDYEQPGGSGGRDVGAPPASPPPLSMNLVGPGRMSIDAGGAGGAGIVAHTEGRDGEQDIHGDEDDEEDEDIYGKTLRPTSEQLVSTSSGN